MNENKIDINTVITNNVKLQTEVSEDTKDYLRVESVRRHMTMGKLIDELVKLFCGVSKTTS